MSRPAALVAVLALTALSLLPTATPAAAQPAAGRAFRDLGYADQTVRSNDGSLSYFFAVPSGQQPQPGAQIDLIYSRSQALAPDRSTITVTVNGRTVASAFLADNGRERAGVTVPLPSEALAGGGFLVQVAFRLRSASQECEQPRDSAHWATVHGESRLILATRASDAGRTLAGLEGLLVPSGVDAASAPLWIGVPFPDGSPEELRAAGLAAFQYGRWAGAAHGDPLIDAAPTMPPGARAGILVGTGGRLGDRASGGTLRWDGGRFTGPGGSLPEEHGVLALAGREQPLLIVSGATPEAVLTAVEGLVQPERRSLLGGSSAVITGAPVASNPAGRPWRDGAASFAQLGVERREVLGQGLHILHFSFERPPGWDLADGSRLDLAIEVTPAVRRDVSSVAARVNGIDLGAKPVQPDAAGMGRYTFPLPFERLNADIQGQPQRRLALEIRLHLDASENGCDAPAPEDVRAAVLPTSSWWLPHDEYRGLDLGRFPAMFFGEDREPVTVVIPERAGPVELAAGLEVMAALGRWSGSEEAAWPRLTTAAWLSGEERRGHLILIGGPRQNAVSEAARAKDRTLFRDGEPPVYQVAADRGPRWGTLQLVRSPWGRGRMLLAISGNDLAGLRMTASALARAETLARIQGRTVIIADGLPPQTVTGADLPSLPPTDLAPRVERSFRERLRPWQVGGALLLGGFVATVAALLASRLRRRA